MAPARSISCSCIFSAALLMEVASFNAWLAVDFAQNDIQGADDGHNVGNHPPFGHLRQCLEIDK